MHGKLTRTELICVAAAVVFIALAAGLRLCSAGSGGVTVAPSSPGALPTESAGETAEPARTGLVNLNTASAEELSALPGIGEVKAKAIVEYRREHGPFTSTAGVMDVSGIGQGTYDKIKDYITAGED